MRFALFSEREAWRLSREHREADDQSMLRRRQIARLALGSAATMGLISLYQTGLLRRLPDLPLPYLDANGVDASADAYRLLGVGDALLGVTSYAMTATLAMAGRADRNRRSRIPALAMTGKVLFDVGQALRLTVVQWRKHRSFCIWCLAAAGATFATLPPALRDVRGVLRA